MGTLIVTTAIDRPAIDSLQEEQSRLRLLLSRQRRRLQLQMTLEFALGALSVVVAAAASLVFLDWRFRLGLSARVAILAVVSIGVVPLLAVWAVRRWRASRLDDLSLAMTLDRYRPGTGTRVADVLQLPGQLAESPDTVSPAMIRMAVRQASEALAVSDWASLWNRGRTASRSLALLVALLVPALFALLTPQAARLSVARWLAGSNERWPQRTYLAVTGLNGGDRLIAPRDEPFTLEVRADLSDIEAGQGRWLLHGRGKPFSLSSRPRGSEAPKEVRVRERTANGAVRDAVMLATGPSIYRLDLPPSSATTAIEVRGGDDWLDPIKIERVDRPSLVAAKLRVREPGTIGEELKPVEEGIQHPVFLADTEVELTLVGSEPIADVRLTVHPGTPPKLDRTESKTFTARWTLREATTLEVQLTSRETGLTSKPAFLSLGLLKDREPRVSLRALGVGSHVTSVATIPLSLAATDDRGLGAVRLQLERTTPAADEKAAPKNSKTTVVLPLAGEAGRAVLDYQVRHDAELQASPPPVGTLLRFVGEAEDRCARGVQVGRSTALQMLVVSADELFYEILMRQRAERAKFAAVVENEEKKGAAMSGAPAPEDYANATRGLHADSRQLELIVGRIADTLQEMKLNQVGSPKSHRLLEEGVVAPIRALNAGPVSELRGVLQSLAGTGPKVNGADAESARRLHGVVLARLKMILDQMSQWESFVDVVNQVAEVIKMQQNIQKAAEKARESRTQEVFDGKP